MEVAVLALGLEGGFGAVVASDQVTRQGQSTRQVGGEEMYRPRSSRPHRLVATGITRQRVLIQGKNNVREVIVDVHMRVLACSIVLPGLRRIWFGRERLRFGTWTVYST